MMDKHREAYREEALELLGDLERSVLELESRPTDRELIAQIFRQMHTIKGSGAMFGFDEIASFTHELETAYDLLRSGRMEVTQELIGLTLQARDHLLALVETPDDPQRANPESGAAILAGFRRLMKGGDGATAAEAGSEPVQKPNAASRASFLLHFEPAPDVFQNGTNLPALFDDLAGLGECTFFAHTADVPPLDQLDPGRCYLRWDALLTGAVSADAIRDIFIFVEDDAVLTVEQLTLDPSGSPTAEHLSAILERHNELEATPLLAALQQHSHHEVKPQEVPAAARKVSESTAATQAETPRDAATSIRVSAEKVDGLMNLVGELVTLEARLGQIAGDIGDPDLLFVSEQVERISQLLRDSALGMRMLPLATSFGRFRRLVRDLSKELGKQVEFVTEGGETELDKTVIERLNDVFVHLIRNSIDHGIEPVETRLAAGKPAIGTVRLSAIHSGAHVLVRVEDDGAGLDAERIKAKAIERGILVPGTELSEKETFALIMRAGFSTASTVTDISGRGVGMDVVQRTISALRGSIEIGSERGRGTRFTLKLPLTLAIIDGLLVQVADQFFVLPQANIIECIELTRREREGSRRQSYAVVRGQIVPYVDVREQFEIHGELPANLQVIIADTDHGKVGVIVDSVVGDYQTVIKPLGSLCRNLESISGATILGDGSIALILDVEKLAAEAVRESEGRLLPKAG